MQLAAPSIEKLVSQAEEEGVTLAEVISRELSPEEMDLLQSQIDRELSENYGNIVDFMSGVEVPTVYDFDAMTEEELDDLQREIAIALSDDMLVESID